MRKISSIIILLATLTPLSLLAHGSHGTGFVAGLTHPIFGLDHLVAILGIAILGFGLFKNRNWLPTLSFISTMLLGALLGINNEALSFTEGVIVFSVLATGLLLVFKIVSPSILLAITFAFFGFFHGHAHGVEMPQESNIPLFILGFILGVVIISAIGWAISKILKKDSHFQIIGGFIAGMGLMMILG